MSVIDEIKAELAVIKIPDERQESFGLFFPSEAARQFALDAPARLAALCEYVSAFEELWEDQEVRAALVDKGTGLYYVIDKARRNLDLGEEDKDGR